MDKFTDPVGQPFVFPEQILHQISECAPEGFILFFIDNMGEPKVRANFNHQVTEMGLRSYATKFLKGINDVEESSIAETLSKDNEEPEEENG